MTTRLFLAIFGIAALASAAGESAFYLPIRNDDLAAVRKLIHDAGPGVRDGRGNTPLMYAAALGSVVAVQMLVEAGADVNAANDFGATPLMWCAGDERKVRYLLGKGANVNARSKLGRTPLLIAATYDGSIGIVREMLAKGADVKAADEGGMTVLESAAGNNNIEVARLLIAKGAPVDTHDGLGVTPLIQGAWSGGPNGDMVRLMIEHGADVNAATGDVLDTAKNGPLRIGRLTALQVAAGIGNYEAVEALVKAGAKIDARDIRDTTALVFAVATDHADPRIVRLLVGRGAAREPAIPLAKRYGNPGVLAELSIPPEKPAAEPVRDARSPREAIEKALALSQPASKNFLGAGGCLSCHAQHFNGLAVAAAKTAGVRADYQLETTEAHATASLRGGIEQALYQIQDPPAGVDAQQLSLMQMAGSKLAPSLATDSLVHHIAGMQRKEGNWPNYGLQRPPLEDGPFSHTAMGIRALHLYMIPGRKAEFEERIAHAAAWLVHAKPITTEDRAMQILGIMWSGRKPSADLVKELSAQQHADGGWSQTPYLAGDAYATGEVLWALHEAGVPASNAAWRRGAEYLLKTQREDGSWHVTTRAFAFQPYFESGFPYGRDQWISQAGSAMAVIALSFAAERQ
jgi:ankyrin repeat protein